MLEIGSGWGGFAVWAATHYGCRVTTTTISDEQYRHASEWRLRIGEAGSRIDVRQTDYRELTGRFDKVVSIEMFEAVGLSHYDDYFTAVDRLLAPDGVMFLQTITVDDQWFPKYHGTPDWIEKYIFPGGELASVGEILQSLARSTSLSLYHAENCGTHYAYTLRAWRARFHRNLARVRALGFDAALRPHVGLVSGIVRSDVSRTPHGALPAAPAEERGPARPLQRAVGRTCHADAVRGGQRIGGLEVGRHETH